MNQFAINQLYQKGSLQFLAFNPAQRLILLQTFFKSGKEFSLTDLLIVNLNQWCNLSTTGSESQPATKPTRQRQSMDRIRK